MSSIGNPSMYVRKAVKHLSAALVVALLAMMTMMVTPALADDEAIILVTHNPASIQAIKGSSVTFKIKVENKVGNPNVLQGVTITKEECDTLTQTSGATDGTIPIGGSLEYACTINNVGSSNFQNQFIVNATNAGAPVTDSSIAQVTVLDPVIHVTKVGSPAEITLGNNAVFTIKVKNTGTTAIDNSGAVKQLAVDDAQCDTLTAPVEGNPATANILDGDANVNDGTIGGEEWTYTCTVNKPLTDVTNTVMANATINGAQYPRTATAKVTVLVPGLNITKSVDKPVVSLKSNGVGGYENASVKWTVKLINTGQVVLTHPGAAPIDAVTDSISSGACALAFIGTDTGTPNQLSPGETWTYECTSTHNTPGDVTNTATEKFANDGKVDVQAQATAKFVVPGMSITKSPAYDEKAQNSNVSWVITVKNTGFSNLTDVVLTDLLCSNGTNGVLTPTEKGNGDNILNADVASTIPVNEAEEWKYVCNYSNIQNDITNVAAVTAKDLSGNKVEGLATAFVKVIKPDVTLTKKLQNTVTVGKNELYEGQKAVFELTVENTGNGPLTDIKIEDFGCDAPNTFTKATLAPAEKHTVTCEKKAGTVTDGFENVANASAKDQFGKDVQDGDKITVNVLIAGLLLEKTPAENIAKEGDTPTWKLIVRNTGDGALNPQDHVGTTDDAFGIYDPLCPQPANLVRTASGNGDGILNPGEVWEFSCTASPLLTYSSDEIINTAFAWFKDNASNDKRDSEKAIVRVVRQSIDLDKKAEPAVVVAGKPVTFKFDVRNFGSSNLTNVKVADTMCPGGFATQTGNGDGDALLEAGELWTFSCEVPGSQVTKDFTNIATATATNANNQAVSDADDASVTVINAKLDVIKTAKTPTIQQGSSVEFEIAAKNTGTIQLKTVTPIDEDPRCVLGTYSGDTTPLNGLLDPNETWIWKCTITNVQSSFVNKAKVTAVEVGNNLAVEDSAEAPVTVMKPGINLDKIANSNSVNQGGTAYFTILISNAGGTNLTTVLPSDADCDALIVISKGDGDAILNMGEVWVYSCTVSDVQGVNGVYTNHASVTAIDTNGVPVDANDNASVTVIATPTPTPTPVTPTPTPVTPTVTPTPAPPTATPAPPTGKLKLQKSPATQTIVKGATATFQVTLNNGTVEDLSNVSLSDPQCTTLTRDADAPGNNDNTLNKGETWRWTCTITNVQKSFTNKAKATAFRPSGKKLTASASAKVKVVNSNQLRIETSVTDVAVNPGASLPMRVTVTNIGAGNLRDLQVSHDACTDALVYVGGDVNGDNVLNRGESWGYTCTIANIQTDVNGLATAAAIDDSNVVQEADELTDVTVITAEESEEAAEAPAFKIFTPLIVR